MAEQAIYTSNLHKSYGSLHVLRGVDLEVSQGEVWGLLGPNGAGKSTLMHLILGLLKPDDGTIRVLGVEEREQLSARIGYLPERPRYHNQFTGREYLVTLGRLSGMGGKSLHDRIDTVIDLVGLGQSAERRIGTYSKGMLQRIGIAQAVLHEPDLLIVDEPASGLDPGGQREMAALLRTLSDTGHTIFLCTHQLTEVARLCDRVGVLVGGKITHTSTLAALHEQGHSVTIRVTDLPLETANALQAIGPEVRYDRLSVTIFPSSDALLATVLRRLLDDDVAIQAIMPEADALEQFYLNAVRDGQAAAAAPPPATSEDLLETLIEDR
ncbi:MAG TPA: ABC transporter ATP-binding protein [Herpetosiphonaceae bacterium]